MKKIIFAEAFRLRKALWLLPALMLAQIAVITFFEPYQYTDRGFIYFTPAEYRQLIRDINIGELSYEDVYMQRDKLEEYNRTCWTESGNSIHLTTPKLRYTEHAFGEESLYSYIAADIERTARYQEYLHEIQEAAKRLSTASIFHTSSGYTERAVNKTAERYAALFSIQPKWSDPFGVRIAITPEGIEWLSFLGLLVFAMLLMSGTRSADDLLRSTRKGRKSLLLARLVCISVYAVCLATALTLSGVLYGALYYGLGDLSRPVQAVFQESPWALSGGVAIVVIWGLRCFLLLLLALPIAVLFHILPNMLACLGISAAAMGLGMIGYSVIPVYSWMNVLKWVNPFGFLNPESMILQYWSVNLFAQPVVLIWVVCGTGVAFAAFCSGLAIIKADNISKSFVLSSWKRDLSKPKHYSTRIFPHEIWRLLWGYKTLIILFCLAAVSVWRCWSFTPRIYPDEAFYRNTVETLITLPDDERLPWVEDALASTSSSWREDALLRAQSKLMYLSNEPDGVLLYDSGWKYLLGLTEQSRRNYMVSILILTIGITLCVAPVREQDATSLLRTAKHGRNPLTRNKLIVSGLTGIAITGLALFPNLWHAVKIFGLPESTVVALSLPELAGYGHPLWMQGFAVLGAGLLLGVLLSTAVYWVSRFGFRVALTAGAAGAVACLLLMTV
jgi:hypothetical protein